MGFLVDKTEFAILSGVLIYFIKHAFYLIKLSYQITVKEQISYPYPLGVWGLINQEIDQQRSRSRRRKRNLNRFTNRFRRVASVIPDAYVLLDKAARVEWSNLAAKRLLNISWPRDEGADMLNLLAYPDFSEYLEAADYSRPFEFPSPINKGIILSLRITPFGAKKNQRLVVARDITDMFHLNQARRDFVSNVSHELRTPLTVITGYLENLSENNPLPFQQRPFTLMLQQASRMNTIISDLLTLSKLEMAERASNHKPVAVPELINRVLDQAAPLAEQKGGYQIERSLDENLWLVGNEDELQSAFSNLIFNAINHTPPKTRIRIEWRREEEYARFRVCDTGLGIPERHIPRLTERFYRVDKARSRQSGGTGLGLAIVKHIINRHEGELLISSRDGQGSCFTCSFPEDMLLARMSENDQESH